MTLLYSKPLCGAFPLSAKVSPAIFLSDLRDLKQLLDSVAQVKCHGTWRLAVVLH
ncbi:hypothetical protein ACLBWH_12200 [Sphingomonas sp. M6A6_1c]